MSLEVQHSRGEYPVRFYELERLFENLPPGSRIITDSNVYETYKDILPIGVPHIIVPPGETAKSIHQYSEVMEKLAEAEADRSTTIVAFGGGVVGDLAGFVAASYLRGVELLQIPTSLLSMVDSSVGGKTGINLRAGKNLVGAFYPPREVRICPMLLKTLPEREFTNGAAEVWKYGFIGNTELLAELKAGPPDSRNWDRIIEKCIQQKALIAQEDEFEKTGLRATLNFGHTVGHALESYLNYGALLHGEAVAIGMVVEAKLAEVLGLAKVGLSQEIANLLRSDGLPVTHPALAEVESLLEIMRRDKKARNGNLAFSLVHELGCCKLVADVSEDSVRRALK